MHHATLHRRRHPHFLFKGWTFSFLLVEGFCVLFFLFFFFSLTFSYPFLHRSSLPSHWGKGSSIVEKTRHCTPCGSFFPNHMKQYKRESNTGLINYSNICLWLRVLVTVHYLFANDSARIWTTLFETGQIDGSVLFFFLSFFPFGPHFSRAESRMIDNKGTKQRESPSPVIASVGKPSASSSILSNFRSISRIEDFFFFIFRHPKILFLSRHASSHLSFRYP